MPSETPPPRPTPLHGHASAAAACVAAAVFACTLYAGLSLEVREPSGYRYFPPFEAGRNRYRPEHLGSEHLNIARALAGGRGFADPFGPPTGPTAWMPPALPVIQAALLHAFGGDTEYVAAAAAWLQAGSLALAGVTVVVVARRTAPSVPPWAVACAFGVAVAADFRLAFQVTHDHWLVLLALNSALGIIWLDRPPGTAAAAVRWGLVGGACALVSPVAGFAWGGLTLRLFRRGLALRRLAVAGAAALALVSPWVARNYAQFGRFVPVKSNLGYELFQSQCRATDGVICAATFRAHPNENPWELADYLREGEQVYVERHLRAFEDSVAADPAEFARRVWRRFLAACVWYTPFDPEGESRHPWGLWLARAAHPVPFLAALALAVPAWRAELPQEPAAGLVVYCAFLSPYILVGYYDRYAFPLVGVKVLLVVWATERVVSAIRSRRVSLVGHKPVPSAAT